MTQFIESFEEVDIAFAEYLSGLQVEGKTVNISYYTPDLDIKKLEMPGLVLYRTNPMRDLSRWNNEREFFDNDVLDGEGKVIARDRRLHPEPWSILYTVKILYEYQMDGIEMNRQLLRRFTRGTFLTINGVNYDVDMLTAGLWGSQYKDFGKVEDGERRFQETFSFRVDIYLEIDDRRTSKTVQEVVVTNVPPTIEKGGSEDGID